MNEGNREELCPDSPTRSFGRKLARHLSSSAVPVSTMELGRRDVVYSCPASDECIYLVVQGLVKAVVPSRDGKECLVGIHGTGEVFGELCLVENVRTESTVAMTPVVLKRVSASSVLSSLDEPGLREDIVRHLASRVLEQQQMISDLVTTGSEYRLAAVVLQLGRKLGRRNGELLLIGERITQEELAGMVGTTRSRIGHFLKRFRAAGLVRRPKHGFLLVDEARILGYLNGELDLDAQRGARPDVARGRAGARHAAVRPQRTAPVLRKPSAGRPAVARLRPAAR
jgi:CRP/FNR family cyclic AMP-dependent transcriptional regulator